MKDNAETPNINNLLMAYAKVVNRVSTAVLEDGQPQLSDVTLLQALSSAVQAIGSEFERNVLGSQIQAAGSRIVQ